MSTEAIRPLTTMAKSALVGAGVSSTVMLLTITAQPVVAWICALLTVLLVVALFLANRGLRKLGAREVGGVESNP